MKDIQAGSVGMNWRSSVMWNAQHGAVRVTDLNGTQIAIVSTRAAGKAWHYICDGKVISHDNLWLKMHEWSDLISRQLSERSK